MHTGRLVFSQLMDFLPKHRFDKCVERYQGNYRTRRCSCFDQFLSMAFAQLTYRESLRGIEICLTAMGPKLYHAGMDELILELGAFWTVVTSTSNACIGLQRI